VPVADTLFAVEPGSCTREFVLDARFYLYRGLFSRSARSVDMCDLKFGDIDIRRNSKRRLECIQKCSTIECWLLCKTISSNINTQRTANQMGVCRLRRNSRKLCCQMFFEPVYFSCGLNEADAPVLQDAPDLVRVDLFEKTIEFRMHFEQNLIKWALVAIVRTNLELIQRAISAESPKRWIQRGKWVPDCGWKESYSGCY